MPVQIDIYLDLDQAWGCEYIQSTTEVFFPSVCQKALKIWKKLWRILVKIFEVSSLEKNY